MSLFDRLVDEALRGQSGLASLRPVVEKELLHHDILREMAEAGLLHQLTFMGGTCLRACYGSSRLSEDLDFTGGADFDRATLRELGAVLVAGLEAKYDLATTVSEPQRETGRVDTWKVRVTTRPQRPDLPAQRIHIDICAIPSYDRRAMVLRNPYGVDLGTGGLILQAESREEIMADKLIALALRPNRLKNRDLWDIGWLHQQGVTLPLGLLPSKVSDHGYAVTEFVAQLNERVGLLRTEVPLREAFVREMTRFLPPPLATETVPDQSFWGWLVGVVDEECKRAAQVLAGPRDPKPFKM